MAPLRWWLRQVADMGKMLVWAAFRQARQTRSKLIRWRSK